MHVYGQISFNNMDSFIYFLRNKECHRPEQVLGIVSMVKEPQDTEFLRASLTLSH